MSKWCNVTHFVMAGHIYQAFMCVRDMTAGLYRMCVWYLSLQCRPCWFCSLSPQQQQGELCAAWYTEICTKCWSPLYSSFSELFVVYVSFSLSFSLCVYVCERLRLSLCELFVVYVSFSLSFSLCMYVCERLRLSLCAVCQLSVLNLMPDSWHCLLCIWLCVCVRERERISLLRFVVASWNRYACFIHSTAAI